MRRQRRSTNTRGGEKYVTFFQYIKPSSINHRLLPLPNLSIFRRAYMVPCSSHTRARRVTRITVECAAMRNASDYKLTNKSSSTPMQCTLYIQSPSQNYTLLNRAFENQIYIFWLVDHDNKVSIICV